MSTRRKDPRKEARQERSQATLAAIMEAIERIVATSGWDALRIAEVARVAGVGKASIYDYFPTREALVAAWAEQVIQKELPRFSALVTELMTNPPPVEDAMAMLVDASMDCFARYATVFRSKERFVNLVRP